MLPEELSEVLPDVEPEVSLLALAAASLVFFLSSSIDLVSLSIRSFSVRGFFPL